MSTQALQERLQALISSNVRGAEDVCVEALTAMAGGNARQAWAFRAVSEGTSREYVLLARTGPGQLDVDPRQEFDALARLSGRGLPVPQALCIDADGSVLGMQGIVMQRGAGRSDIGELLKPGSDITRGLATQLAGIAARLHGQRWPDAPADWRPEAMLQLWRAQFLQVRLEPLPALSLIFDWLEEHMPGPAQAVLVHGDLRLGNFLHDGNDITLLLDWELSHWGDPAEDMAWMYRRLWSPEAFLPLDEALAVYEASGAPPLCPARLDWYRVFAEAKLAVISLTAVRNFIEGRTHNLRHAGRLPMVNECLLDALRRIESLEGAC